MPETQPNVTLWYLANLEFFEELREQSIASLAENCKLASWSKGERLSASLNTTKVFFIVKGRVEICTYQSTGKKVIHDHVGEGGVLGWNEPFSLLASASGNQEAIAVEETEALIYSREYIMNMIERRPRVAVKLLRYMGLRQQRIEFRLQAVLFRSNLLKVAGLILELADSYGIRSNGEILIDSGLTQEDIGAMVGLPREEVTRAITQLRDRGFIALRKRRIDIIKHRELAELLE